MNVALVGLTIAVLAGAAAAVGYVIGERDDEEEAAEATSLCVNAREGYRVEFPAGWYVGGTHEDPGRADLVCSFFDPERFDIPANTDFFGTALEVHTIEVPFEEALRSLTDPRFARTLSRRTVTLRGHRAARLETEATGEGLLDRGTRTYAYLVRRPHGPPVLVQTTAPPREPLRWRSVVDRAARSLRLVPVPPDRLTGVPDAVAEKHAAMLLAVDEARSTGNVDALAALADRQNFTYTFGGPVPGGPAAYWRTLERRGERPLETLATILRLPYTLTRGVYVWPFAFDKPENELTAHERELLGPLRGSYVGGSYLGWRAGIEADGDWIFFVAGD